MKKLLLSFILVFSVAIAFALNPKKEYDVTPTDYGMDYEEITIPSTDTFKLNAWFYKPRKNSKSSKLIIIAGSGDGNMEDLIEVAGKFVSIGYHVITFDYRGYGKSTDFKVSSKFYIYSQFAQDLESVVDWSHKYQAKLAKDMYGVGVGAGLVIAVGANKPVINRVIADGAYFTLETVSKRIEASGSKVLMPMGYDATTLEPKFALESKGIHLDKVLLFVGDKDIINTVEDQKALAKINKKCVVSVFKGNDNKSSFASNKDEYFTRIKDFLGIE